MKDAGIAQLAGELMARSLREFAEDRCGQMAAAISYYVLISLFPLLLVVIGVAGLLIAHGSEQALIAAVLGYLPAGGQVDLGALVAKVVGSVSGSRGAAIGVFGLLGLAWTASGMFGVIRNSLNVAYDLEQRRPLLQQKAMDLGLVALTGVFFAASIGITMLLRIARQSLPVLSPGWDLGWAWDGISIVLPLLLLFAAFTFVYWLVPARRLRLREIWPGSLAATVLFELAQLAFAAYLGHFSRYNLVYGSLGAVVALLFWVYIGAAILLFGAEVASEYARQRDEEKRRPANEPPERSSLRRRAAAFLRALVVER